MSLLSMLKIIDRLYLGGDVGIYFIGFMDMEIKYRTVFIQLFRCFQHLMQNDISDADITKHASNMYRVLAVLERLLPLTWNVIVRHLLLHFKKSIIKHGRFRAINLLCGERHHIKIMKMALMGKKLLMETLKNKINAQQRSTLANYDGFTLHIILLILYSQFVI